MNEAMVKVRLLVCRSGPDEHLLPGAILDVSAAKATAMIEQGEAEYLPVPIVPVRPTPLRQRTWACEGPEGEKGEKGENDQAQTPTPQRAMADAERAVAPPADASAVRGGARGRRPGAPAAFTTH